MPNPSPTRVLFTGYAPVHFVCFAPLYQRLLRSDRFDVRVSGGLRSENDEGTRHHDAPGMYHPLGIPDDRILTLEQIQEMDFDLLFGANTNLLAPRSAALRIQLFHGISFRNKAVRAENLGCDYYFIVGPYMRRKFAEAGLLPEGDPRALPIGFMKTDRLLDGQLDRVELLRRHGFDGSRPVLLYAPTGQRYNSMETMGEEVVRRLAAAGRYDLLIKLHDHPKDDSINWFERLAPLEDAHTRVAREPDVIPLLFLADLLITDASSVSSEYSLLDRPIVFLDVPKLIAKAGKSGSLDMDTWGRRAGRLVEQPEDVIAAIDDSLASPSELSPIRKAMAADLFHNPGAATDAAWYWLDQICSGSVPRVHG